MVIARVSELLIDEAIRLSLSFMLDRIGVLISLEGLVVIDRVRGFPSCPILANIFVDLYKICIRFVENKLFATDRIKAPFVSSHYVCHLPKRVEQFLTPILFIRL